eukprot:598012-Pyramimonas_sp.AAC.1
MSKVSLRLRPPLGEGDCRCDKRFQRMRQVHSEGNCGSCLWEREVAGATRDSRECAKCILKITALQF